MNDTLRMHIVDTFHDGIHEVLDLPSSHRVLVGLDNVHQVLAAVFHNKVKAVEIIRVSWPHDSLELHDVLVTSQDSHKFHFSQESVGIDVTFKDILD